MSKINKPTLSDYNKIEDFASACAELNSALSLLNNHIEILKRSGDVELLRKLGSELYDFLTKVVVEYKKTLEDVKEN